MFQRLKKRWAIYTNRINNIKTNKKNGMTSNKQELKNDNILKFTFK